MRIPRILGHPPESRGQLVEDSLSYRHDVVLGGVQRPHNTLHHILVLVQILLIDNSKQTSEQTLEEGLNIRSAESVLLLSIGPIFLRCENLLNGRGGVGMHNNTFGRKVSNEQWHQCLELVLAELIAERANEFDSRRLDHRPDGHVRFLELRQNVLLEKLHDIYILIDLRHTLLRALCSDCSAQHQMDLLLEE